MVQKKYAVKIIAGIYAPDKGCKGKRQCNTFSGCWYRFQGDLTGRENIMLSGSIHGFRQDEVKN